MSTVLLVDDEVENLWALQLALESCGHHVVLAENGCEALQKLQRQLPRLIITDWQMPGMDGVELCHRVRCQPSLADLPIILLSATSEPKGYRPCWTAFFQKPANVTALLDSVNVYIAERLAEASRKPALGDPAPSRLQPIDSRCWP
ncbi:response regulator [Paraburkholderia diazotrophica]|uniref:Response regulator receiver domain-containing protein n=1 Tax=Paraburkholderia diazotrophica TaxID=667676 RepID=A0A1H7E6U6_9BURK|nr:response regulator [Paraburkholderia diazotrophica]SEK07390.1 Response regulator receiver domain-containing protein [Paraburkholderia diazotrophica]